ncbi:hypothetical protein DUNSADRAFT_17041 [Dunaliella salina]|uniref:Maltose/galactoside acetyltransferase domain-containing protein n=1 Tax=Dunaliella salina TaxID=3046 RepID=A0ABQ7H0G5_DUNSA|nr:hypothetical protein DUNSADRAFT_17041 [Dunaliella salina]|eukprot:KAF5840344.1 hypothetical protein DUNSADRAFT_17041 [Dunaliella salina]
MGDDEGTLPPGSQKTRMLAGRPYHQGRDPVLVEERRVARRLVEQLDSIPVDEGEKRAETMKELFGGLVEGFYPWIERGFKCDFGRYISFGRDVYINYNVLIIDCGYIKIGDRVLIGPNVSLLGATHPIHPALRNGTQVGISSKVP